MAKASECSAPAIPNMSTEYNGSSEMGARQPMVVGRKLLPPVTAGGAPVFVSERQYDAIIRLRERRRRIKEASERRGIKVKRIRRDPKGRFVKNKGTNGGIMVPFSATQRDSITVNGYQDVTTAGSELQNSTPAIGSYGPSVATNEGGENIGKVTSATGGYDEATTSGSKVEATSDSKVPVSNTAGDFYWPVVATNDEEENVGEFAYSSILNLESPDPTTLLKIMMGNRYGTNSVSEQFWNLARLQAPDFATLMTVMNNAGYDAAVDDGHYDVDKVMAKLEGWEPAAGPSYSDLPLPPFLQPDDVDLLSSLVDGYLSVSPSPKS